MLGFDSELTSLIVTGMVAGYKDYSLERRSKNQSMIISDGFAYTKSHYIQDQVAKHTNRILRYKKRTAGPSWKYLEFYHPIDSYIFLCLDERYFDENNIVNGKDINGLSNEKTKKYLVPLVEINREADIPADMPKIKGQKVQLSMDLNYEDEANDLSNQESGELFYIVTYNIDTNTRMLDSIKIWLPIPESRTAILIEDLTETLKEVQSDHPDYEITENERLVLNNEETHEQHVPDAAAAFDYDIDLEEEEKF